jgi:phosphoribosylaminoimidazolecarboxamide formyltransferase / IMP cyclohydrolase
LTRFRHFRKKPRRVSALLHCRIATEPRLNISGIAEAMTPAFGLAPAAAASLVSVPSFTGAQSAVRSFNTPALASPRRSRRTMTPTIASASTSSAETPAVAATPAAATAPVRIRRALISVSDKTCLTGLARDLSARGVEILSTGGSATALRDAGLPVRDVADYTGFPEMMGGRLKTLHPKIHGGLLAIRGDEGHETSMTEYGIEAIDLVIVNLYPFEETVAQDKPFDVCVENIDVGGPTMVRAACKNYAHVVTVTDPRQYPALLTELSDNDGATTEALRKSFAAAAFSRLAAYDAAVASRFAAELGEDFPERALFPATLKQTLRYGENPHQSAAFYGVPAGAAGVRPGVATAVQVQGKELSYNNISDTDAAFELVSEFPIENGPVCAIIKHANPCGVAAGVSPQDAYLRALSCDPTSAFGGIVALNTTIDKHIAVEITQIFTEVVIAPDASAEALEVLATKKNIRVLLTGRMPDPSETGMTFKSVSGGMLVQTRDNGVITAEDVKVVTKRAPTEKEMKDLLFAWKVCKYVKSNAIVYVKDCVSVGTGAGQMSRVDSSRIAALKAKEACDAADEDQSRTIGSVVASDAFFPFADGLIAAAEAGATAVIQPGGSKRDDEVIAAANDRGIAMVMAGIRHFRH